MCLWFLLWVFSGEFPVNLFSTPLVCLHWVSSTWSYRNSTLFDRTIGTELLHFSNSGESFCASIAVSRPDSIALVVQCCRLYWVKSSWHAAVEISRVSSNIVPLIHNYIVPSEFQTTKLWVIFTSLKRLTCTTNSIPIKPITTLSILLLTSPPHHQTSHLHHKSHSHKAHYNFLHPPVNPSTSPPNVSPAPQIPFP